MTQNRPSDLLDQRRNSFGFQYPNNVCIIGTKGDVQTFFLVLNDLIAMGWLADAYQTISQDLYRTLVNADNFERFRQEAPALKEAFANIPTARIDWDKYPFNREEGQFDYQQKRIDISRPNLAEVFQKCFKAFEDAPFFIQKYLDRGMKDFPRLYTSPTEIITGNMLSKLPDEDFLDAVDDPLWLRVPG